LLACRNWDVPVVPRAVVISPIPTAANIPVAPAAGAAVAAGVGNGDVAAAVVVAGVVVRRVDGDRAHGGENASWWDVA